MLNTEQNTPAMYDRVLDAAETSLLTDADSPDDLSADFEHGQWWITNTRTGTQWSVVDATGGASVDGFDFEQVSAGDED